MRLRNVNVWASLIVFVLSLALYLICIDPGASFWDCPEYILVAWRLEIGHPPGNPTWQLLANVVSHLGGSAATAAFLINLISAVATATACALLCDIIYIFIRYAILRGGSRRNALPAAVCAVGGSLCFAWCDSVIFSAVEAEVYALSIMFTALMVWLALRWARLRLAGRRGAATRIAILTWYIAGLSMGVHELNLLALPAMGLIYWYAYRQIRGHGRPLVRTLTTSLAGILFFILGCTTYLIIPIRGAANPPVNQGHPATLAAFKSYYGRDQYGSKPLLYGHTPYAKPMMEEEVDEDGNYIYKRYFIKENGGKRSYVYPDEMNMFLPRMTSTDTMDLRSYKAWAGMSEEDMVKVYPAYAVDSMGNQVRKMNNATGEREPRSGTPTYRPTYWQQLRYMLGYQIGYMYFRYLMWNFSGRQNNVPATGEIDHGNFLTGITPLDDLILGAQSSLPTELKEENRGYNRYFMIPFLLGIAGACLLINYGRRGRRVLAITLTLFVMTGIAIVIYLNQDPGEPRERDYSFLGSYMAFAMWIAFAFAVIWRYVSRRWGKKPRLQSVGKYLCLLLIAGVPCLMLSQNYDDHNRSGRDAATAVASNILNSLDKDAIIFTDGDNVIFPLWYAQEVLSLRRDVTVIANGYLPAGWYRSQLALPGEGSLPVAFTYEGKDSGFVSQEKVVRSIIEGNAALENPRPIYWHAAISERSAFKPFMENADLTLFAYRLNPGEGSGESAYAALLDGYKSVGTLKSGGTENALFYAEPYVAEALGRQRKALINVSDSLLTYGDTVRAQAVRDAALRLWPYDKVPPQTMEVLPDSLQERRRLQFQRYYDAMPPARRPAISRESLRIISD